MLEGGYPLEYPATCLGVILDEENEGNSEEAMMSLWLRPAYARLHARHTSHASRTNPFVVSRPECDSLGARTRGEKGDGRGELREYLRVKVKA